MKSNGLSEKEREKYMKVLKKYEKQELLDLLIGIILELHINKEATLKEVSNTCSKAQSFCVNILPRLEEELEEIKKEIKNK